MGYNLSIGEATIAWNEEQVKIVVEEIKLPEAPAFGEATDHTNQRWPSYTSWSNFCEILDIKDIMLNERNGGCDELQIEERKWIYPLILEHPGAQPILPYHLNYIQEKYVKLREKYPSIVAGFSESENDDALISGTLARAEWLIFWLNWALKNCKYPTFYNS